jgi:Fe-coproporphyrin III synthase
LVSCVYTRIFDVSKRNNMLVHARIIDESVPDAMQKIPVNNIMEKTIGLMVTMQLSDIIRLPWTACVSTRNLLYRQREKALPLHNFNFEVTRRCNGNCTYCNIWKSKPEKEITADELREGLKPLSLFKSVKSIGITGGEAFLRNDLVELVEALKEICPRADFGFVSNGLQPELILKKMLEIREIADASIGISIDGFSEDDAKQRGNPRHYELAWKTVDLLMSEKIPFQIGSVITPFNLPSAKKFREYCWERAGVESGLMIANVSNHFYSNDSNENMKDLVLTKKDIQLFKELCLGDKPNSWNYYYAKYLENPSQVIPCFSGFSSFFLNSYGIVYPCIHLNMPLGSIRTENFGNLWLGKKSSLIRHHIRQKLCHCYTTCELGNSYYNNIFPRMHARLKLLFPK